MPAGDRIDAEYSLLNGQATAAPQKLSMTGSSVRSTELAPGLYEVVSTVTGNILQGGSAVTATAGSQYIVADRPRLIFVTGASDGFVAGIIASGSLYIQAF